MCNLVPLEEFRAELRRREEEERARELMRRRQADSAYQENLDTGAMAGLDAKKCPGCKTKILREYGCNKMTCSCGTKFCWLCLKNITQEGYNHFSDETSPCYEKLMTGTRGS